MTVRAIVFPTCIKGASGGPGFMTSMYAVASGFEFRNAEWSRQRCEYDIAFGIKKLADDDPPTAEDAAREVRNLFYASLGRAYGFLYFDHNDHTIGTPTVLQGLGTGATFQIFKRYQFGTYYYDRKITRPAAKGSGEIVTLDGTPLAEADYDIDTTTGELTVDGTGVVAIYLPTFYVPVRFDDDLLPQEIMTGLHLMDTSPIRLVEIKEEGVVPEDES